MQCEYTLEEVWTVSAVKQLECLCSCMHVFMCVLQYSSCVPGALIQTAGAHLFLLLLLRPVAQGARCTGMRCLGLDQ